MALSEFRPDLILSDFRFPGLGGLEVLRVARERVPGVPFLFISGTANEEEVVECLKAGADDFLAKDRLETLAVRVSRALKEAEDRRDRTRLEEEFRQAQKMEAVGRLAGGIAHDFNNLLTAILGFSENILQKLDAGSGLRQDAEEIKHAGERAAALTRQLLAFSRRQPLQPKVLDLNAVVVGIERMLRRVIGEDVELRTVLEAEIGHVLADPGQVEQVLLNLAVNARDAMPGGGALTIETRNADLDPEFAKRHPGARAARYVTVSVSDTGTGMTKEVMAHLFEPFFTTKGPGKGTGLGLATVCGIARQSGGFVTVSSKPGRGSVFKVYLPRVEGSASASHESQMVKSVWGAGERILLVEDDASVRMLVRQCLRVHGYEVTETANAADALALVGAKSESLDLLLTDLVMPGMGGRELASKMRERFPGLRVLYMSGYSDDALLRQGKLEAGTSFIPKPFVPTELLVKVRKVLLRGR